MDKNKNERELEVLLTQWTSELGYLELNPDYIKNIYEIKSATIPKRTIKKLEMLDYKKTIIKDIIALEKEDNQDFSLRDFTDEELKRNMFKSKEFANGIKVTKYITKKLKELRPHYMNDQRLDFFHKLRREDTEYFIDSDPMSFVDLYLTIQTCVSPGGENSPNLLRFLLSQYTYIAYDSHGKSRMLIYEDPKKKRVFLNPVYGEFDLMMVYSVIQHYMDEGYEFCQYFNTTFTDDGYIYKDRDSIEFQYLIRAMEGKFAYDDSTEIYKDDVLTHLYEKPDTATFLGDAIENTIKHPYHDKLTTLATLDIGPWCQSCERYVLEDDYNFNSEVCYECDVEYCEVCEQEYDPEDYNYEEYMCMHCVRDREEREQEELLELERQEDEEEEKKFNKEFDEEYDEILNKVKNTIISKLMESDE